MVDLSSAVSIVTNVVVMFGIIWGIVRGEELITSLKQKAIELKKDNDVLSTDLKNTTIAANSMLALMRGRFSKKE